VATEQTLTIDTRSQIVTGRIGDAESGTGRPQAVVLNADGGIASFITGSAGAVTATSSGGSINLNVTGPGQLRVTTGTPGTLDCPTCDISISSGAYDTSIGPDVVLNAGGSVNMSDFKTDTISLTARSGDVNFQTTLVNNTLTASAGRDIVMNKLFWIGPSPNGSGGGPVTLTAGRDITAASLAEIHVSNGQTLTFTANRNLTLFVLETLGAVNLTATTGNITLNNDIGPHITNNTTWPDFNPTDKGVASLNMFAGGSITMQGARAEGNVVITAGTSVTAAKAITSVSGSVTITAPTQTLNQATPIGTQNQVDYPEPVSPVAPPGPKSPLPGAPGAASNGAPGAPVFAEIPVSFADQNVGGVIVPGAANGSVGFSSGGSGGGTPGGTIGDVGRPGSPNGGVGAAGGGNGNGAPGGTSGVAGRPGAAIGSIINAATGSSDPATADTAAALRTAGESCGEEAAGDNGLAAIDPNTPEAGGQSSKASCAAGGGGGAQAAAGASSGAPANTPAAPAGTDPAPATTPGSPIGGGVQ